VNMQLADKVQEQALQELRGARLQREELLRQRARMETVTAVTKREARIDRKIFAALADELHLVDAHIEFWEIAIRSLQASARLLELGAIADESKAAARAAVNRMLS